MKLLRFIFFIALIFCIKNVQAFQGGNDNGKLQKGTLKRIVIDAGHGGSPSASQGNYGASCKYGDEKDITLAIALKLQKDLEQQLPNVEVYMTRTTDVFESVRTKADKANAAKGDLFISIHCNDANPAYHSEIVGYKRETYKRHGKRITKKIPEYRTYSTPSTAKGTETYIWAVGKNQQKEDAIAENEYIDSSDAIMKEMNDPMKKMEIALRTQQYKERSQLLAETVEDEFAKDGRVSRGVRQRDDKGIYVLAAVNMPAVLVETGFLSNDEEAQYLASDKGQQETADAIAEAIKRYKFSLDKKVQNTTTSSTSNK